MSAGLTTLTTPAVTKTKKPSIAPTLNKPIPTAPVEKTLKPLPNTNIKSLPNINLNRKVTSTAEQPAKKRKKLEKEVDDKLLINPSLSMQEDLDKKKKVSNTPELVIYSKKKLIFPFQLTCFK